MPLQLPNDFVNGSLADAVPVEQNYNLIQDYVNANLISRDGSVAMQAPLLLVGDPTQANHAANKDYVDNILPVGIMFPWPAPTPPAGSWMLCQGASLATASYPDLFGVIGYRYGGGGASFNLPNLQGRLLIGQWAGKADFDAVGKIGGAYAVPVPLHDHGTVATGAENAVHYHYMRHDHTMDHNHGAATSSTAGNHVHPLEIQINSAAGTVARPLGSTSSGTQVNVGGSVMSGAGNHAHTVDLGAYAGRTSAGKAGATDMDLTGGQSVNHVHAVTVPAAGTAGVEHLPPYVTIHYIIRVA